MESLILRLRASDDPMADNPKKFDFTESVNKLEEINSWFQNEDIDLDEGLHKLKEGKDLIKKCRTRLKEVENEFIKIKGEFAEETDTEFPEEKDFSNAESDGDIDLQEAPF
jgi:exodeoxyribonuclease VII small subunit